MKILLLSLLTLGSVPTVFAQPVDLLQQLYGKQSPGATRPEASSVPSAMPMKDLVPVIQEPLTLTVRDSFSTSRERVFLADVTTCKGPKQACDEVGAIDLGSAPKAMRQDRLAKTRIIEAVSHEMGSRPISWGGADNCLISALSSPFNEEAVVHVIEHEFASAPKGVRVLIQSVRLPTMQMLRHNNYVYKVPSFGDQVSRVYANPRTRFAQLKVLAVDQDPSSQATIEFIAQVSLRVEVQALVSQGSRERGERITQDFIALEWIPFQDQIVTDEKLVLGKILKSRIMAKQPLRSWDLMREPEVQRGDRIEAVVNTGGIQLNSVAQALEPGFIGQKIRIRLDATKKTLLGVVIARSQVEVPSL
ncbi:MAG: flagellar basal body P-ring formation protein FlgA [Chitinophagaceae bacterium]|nr:flagellar basal body P-ring formation protein FlgA [Oligoflexus sp.]